MATFSDKLALILTMNTAQATAELKKFGGTAPDGSKAEEGLAAVRTALAG